MKTTAFLFILLFAFTAWNKDAFGIEPKDELVVLLEQQSDNVEAIAPAGIIVEQLRDPSLSDCPFPPYTLEAVNAYQALLQYKANLLCLEQSVEILFCSNQGRIKVTITAEPKDCE